MKKKSEGQTVVPMCTIQTECIRIYIYIQCVCRKRLNFAPELYLWQYPIFDLALLLQFCLKILKMYEWLL